MSKTPAAKAAAESTAVATRESALPPAHLMEDMEKYAGAGTSTSLEDTGIPFVYIAQKGSPEVNKRDEVNFIDGLEVGDLICKQTRMTWPSVPNDSKPSLRVVPFAFQKYMVEWKPDRGGYVATHPSDTPLKSKAIQTDKGLILPNGNQLVMTDYHFCTTEDGSPLVIAMASTGLKASRNWINLRNTFKQKTASGSKIVPAWFRVYQIETRYSKNEKGDWFNWHVVDCGWNMDAASVKMSAELWEKSQSGLLTVSRPDDSASGAGGAAGDDGIDV
jgi:hypothetical protein